MHRVDRVLACVGSCVAEWKHTWTVNCSGMAARTCMVQSGSAHLSACVPDLLGARLSVRTGAACSDRPLVAVPVAGGRAPPAHVRANNVTSVDENVLLRGARGTHGDTQLAPGRTRGAPRTVHA